MCHRPAGAGIDRVRNTLSVEQVGVAVVARGCECLSAERDGAVDGGRPGGWALDADAPRLVARAAAAGAHFTAHFHQMVAESLTRQQLRHLIDRVTLRNG